MYWTLETRRPTLDEIIAQGEAEIRQSIEDVCARFEAPQIEVERPRPRTTPTSGLLQLAEAQSKSLRGLATSIDIGGCQSVRPWMPIFSGGG